MRGMLVAGGIAVAAVFVGVYWLARDPAPAAPEPETSAQPPVIPDPAPPAVEAPALPSRAPPKRPEVTDPRLAKLLGRPDDALVEYLPGPDGRVIKEIDRDPNSQGYLKPSRE